MLCSSVSCSCAACCAQVWALQQGSALHAAGRTNRATVTFASEMEAAYQLVPETPPYPSPASGLGLGHPGSNGPAGNGAVNGSAPSPPGERRAADVGRSAPGGEGAGGRDAAAALSGNRG